MKGKPRNSESATSKTILDIEFTEKKKIIVSEFHGKFSYYVFIEKTLIWMMVKTANLESATSKNIIDFELTEKKKKIPEFPVNSVFSRLS